MNRQNILRVAKAIEDHEIASLGFNMSDYFSTNKRLWSKNNPDRDRTGHRCGTVACIAGWALACRAVDEGLVKPDATEDALRQAVTTYQRGGTETVASEYLGLDYTQREHLFCGGKLAGTLSPIRPETAVAVLRHFAETGEIDWSVAL